MTYSMPMLYFNENTFGDFLQIWETTDQNLSVYHQKEWPDFPASETTQGSRSFVKAGILKALHDSNCT